MKKIFHYYRLFLILLLSLVLSCSQSMAQKKITARAISGRGIPSLSKVFKKYALFSISTPEISNYARQKKNAVVDIDLEFPGLSTMKLSLNDNHLLADNYQLTVASSQGDQVSGKPLSITYSGKLTSDKNSKVYLTISDKIIYGFIKGNGKEYFIEPLKYFNKKGASTSFVVYESKDVVPYSGTMCAVTEAAARVKQSAPGALQRNLATGTCKMVKIAIASDASMMAKYDNPLDVESHNIAVVNTMVGIYSDAQLGTQYLSFSIAGQYISAAAANDPFLPAYDGIEVNTMLTNFSAWGQAGRFGFNYDLGQFWTAKDFAYQGSFGVIGLAWIAGVCNANRYQVLEDNNSLSGLQLGILASHETGHNFNAQHDADGANYIMAPSLSNATTFSPASLSAMSAYLSSITCLSTCSSTPMVASFDLPGAICGLGPITLSRISVGDIGSSTWSMPGGTPSSSTSPTQVVSYTTPGIKTVTLTTITPISVDIVTKEVFLDNPVTAGCKTFYTGNAELTSIGSFVLDGIRHDESSIWIGKKYTDNSCTGIASLMTDSVYTVTTAVGLNDDGFNFNFNNRLQAFIDYNDDGDFTDAGESIYASDCVQGKFTFTFKTPVAPVLNRLLRLRVIAMPCNLPLSDGCSIPDNAQIEDYAVSFLGQKYAYYVDGDLDGLGSDLKVWLHTPTAPLGFVKNNLDCDDRVVSSLPPRMVKDHDKDGYYVGDITALCKTTGPDYVPYSNQKPGDCDDNNAAVHPGAFEIADGIDNDCNGAIDDNVCAPTVITKDITVQLNADGQVTITTGQVNNGSYDNCGPLTFSLDKITFSCADLGANTVMLTAKDAAGISASASAVVTIEDHTAPVVITKNITAQINAAGIVTIDDKDVDDGSYDACGPVSYKLDKTKFDCTNIGSNTVTLTVTDASGNSSSGTAIVTVEDHTLPIVITKNIIVQLDASDAVVISDKDVDDGSYDACGSVFYKLDKTRFDCSNVGTNTVILTVTDANGNSALGTAIVTVEDHTLPIVITKNITAQITTGGVAIIADRDVDNGSFDPCGLVSYKLDKTTFDCSNAGPNTVTLTVTDANGNSASGTAVVTVEDHVLPTVITKNITVQLGADGTVTVADRSVDNGSYDACGLVLYKLDKTTFTCYNVGQNTVTLTLKDINGNIASGTAIITVQGAGVATWVLDKDGDGYYINDPVTQCVAPAEGYVVKTTQLPGDCDDNRSDLNPNTVWYKDMDNDGYSDGATKKQCAKPTGYRLASELTALNGDCNDNDAGVHAPVRYYVDADKDGYGTNTSALFCSSTPPVGYANNNTDCNDKNASIRGPQTYYRDADGDGYGDANLVNSIQSCSQPKGYVTNNTDCDDTRATVRPGATEICGNGIDDNCNGQIDENCAVCGNATALSTTNITSTSATLNWVAAVNPVQWQLQYKTSANNAKWIDVTLLAGSARSITLTNLVSKQSYGWHIRAKCGTTWTSYSNTVNFTVLASASLSKSTTSTVNADQDNGNTAISLHPNPSPGRFILELHIPERNIMKAQIELVDMAGRKVYAENTNISNGLLRKEIMLPSQAAHGMYIVHVLTNSKMYQASLLYVK